MRCPRHVRTSALVAIGLSAGWHQAQAQRPSRGNPPAVAASSTAPADAELDAGMAARPARYLLKNGLDYLNYREYDRSLRFFRAIEKRTAELSDGEVQQLRKGIAQAQQGKREAVNGPRLVAQPKGRPTNAPGAMALARVPAAKTAPEPVTLTSGTMPSEPVADLPSAASQPQPLALAMNAPAEMSPAPVAPAELAPTAPASIPEPVGASDGLGLPSLPSSPPSLLPEVNIAQVPPAVVPSTAAARPAPPAVEPAVPSALPEMSTAALPALPEADALSAGLPSLPESAPSPAGLPSLPESAPAGLPSLPESAPSSAGLPTLPESAPAGLPGLPEMGAAPSVDPSAMPTSAAADPLPTLPEMSSTEPAAAAPAGDPPPAYPAPSSSVPADPSVVTPPMPTQAQLAVEAPPVAEATPLPSAASVPVEAIPTPASAMFAAPARSTRARLPEPGPVPDTLLPPRHRAEVERLAQRGAGDNSVGVGGSSPTTLDPNSQISPVQSSTRLELQRAPSPTEARPIKGIAVPEEFVELGRRDWDANRKYWAAAGTCHMILYFQDPVLERYGQGVEQSLGPRGRFFSYPLDDPRQSNQRNQILQPFYSMGKFAFQVGTLPYKLIVDPPWEAEYDLGYYRPGDRIPADTIMITPTGLGPPGRGRKY